MEINIKLGNRIRELRKQKMLSQEALAHISEIDRTYMTKIETGKKNVTVKILEKIIKGLGITFKEFFKEEIDE